jgi:hypothetical protein
MWLSLCDKQFHPSIIVYMGGNHSPRLPRHFCNPGLLGNVAEGSITVVMKQPASRRGINPRDTVVALPRSFIAAELVLGFVKLHEPANEKIELATTHPPRTAGRQPLAGRMRKHRHRQAARDRSPGRSRLASITSICALALPAASNESILPHFFYWTQLCSPGNLRERNPS